MKFLFEKVKECPLCGGQNFGFASIGICEEREYKVTGIDEIYYAKCKCGAIFHEWMMSDETLFEFYQEKYRESTYHETSEMCRHNVDEEVMRAQNLIEHLDVHKRFLDIGSSTGVLLKVVKARVRGVEVVGVEPNKIFRECSNDNVVSDISEVEGKFDFISMIHTIEHLPRPREMLNTIRDLLTDDGTLLLEVPMESFELAHPVTFTKKTFLNLLHDTGYQIKIMQNIRLKIGSKRKNAHLLVVARKNER